MIHIWFLIGLELIVWWQTLANVQIMFLGSNIDNSKITFMIENKREKSRSEVHKRNLRVIYKMEDANFEDLLRIALGLFMKTIFTYCN